MYLQSLLILKVEETEGSMVVVLALLYAKGNLLLQLLVVPSASCCFWWLKRPFQHHGKIFLYILMLDWLVSHSCTSTQQHLWKFHFRFVSLMGGHIWLDSEGTGRGCTATFIIKLGVCDNTNTYQQQLIPLVWPSSADSDSSGPKALPDGKGSASLKSRYQRSVWAYCKWLTRSPK